VGFFARRFQEKMVNPYYVEGIFQVANLLLSVVALVLASLLFFRYNVPALRPWSFVVVGIVLFMTILVFGVLRSFGLYENSYITHVLTGAVLIVLMGCCFSRFAGCDDICAESWVGCPAL